MTIDKAEFLTRSGLKVQTLEFWIEQEWVVPEETATGLAFSDVDIARAHLIRELSEKLGANEAGIDIILHLLDQLHGFRHAFEHLRMHMEANAD